MHPQLYESDYVLTKRCNYLSKKQQVIELIEMLKKSV